MRIGLKNCFNIRSDVTHLGLKDDSLKYLATEDSKVYELLKARNYDIHHSDMMAFCCGVLDLDLKQRDNCYVAGSSTGAVLDLESNKIDVAVCTDTGGSTIVPAGRANLWGYKPTYGVISRSGLVPLCSYLDTVGIMSTQSSTLCEIFKVLAQKDDRDLTSIDLNSFKTLPEIRLRIASNLFSKQNLELLKKTYPQAECSVLQVPDLQVLEGLYWYILCPDFFSNMAKFDGIHHKIKDQGFIKNYTETDIVAIRSQSLSTEIKSRIITGSHILNNSLYDHSKVEKFSDYLDKLLQDFTWILPICKSSIKQNDPSKFDHRYSLIANFTKRPSLTIPNNLTQGYYILGPKYTDTKFLDKFCK
jgi:Asp-tRNA(Asn)/Glu-tRNA(Gln) amidotransferase A subunit family amidase